LSEIVSWINVQPTPKPLVVISLISRITYVVCTLPSLR
jgi:hypothetical protein